jgi:hypothetical protein
MFSWYVTAVAHYTLHHSLYNITTQIRQAFSDAYFIAFAARVAPLVIQENSF